ncbi:hypothetical protein BDN71DRAFT_1444250 [Pleurotus eryngii]|uniref:Uncharacterized protein n=1 Tax=Pleurotus eryngii TaxID=5323 RepID=A0A9P6DAT1_PLEER|nr:hypothetical protein BDN71DRAFT_1444250 [Pleurotus eryngii]
MRQIVACEQHRQDDNRIAPISSSICSPQDITTWCCLKAHAAPKVFGETFIPYRTADSFSIPVNGTLHHPGVWSDITPLALLPGSSPWNISREPIPGNFTGIPHQRTAESDSHAYDKLCVRRAEATFYSGRQRSRQFATVIKIIHSSVPNRWFFH